uniref:Rx N-terminal domain-containing protein n=1 Tax=Fagus sylvatica TaxID=28930 RepID=A0A2N9HEX6_FAGSY
MRAQLLPGKTPKQEVEGWLQDVERMNAEIQAIEREAGEGKCFSRAHVGKLAFKKIGEMEELYQRGVFIDSLVVDPPVSHGETLSQQQVLIGESTAERVKEKIWACLLDDDDVRKIGVYGMGDVPQLPLAIVTIAASFKCLIHDFEWRDALEDLKTSVKGSNNIEAEKVELKNIDEEKFVKMHDLVRDMVLRVASPQFKVEGHLGLEDFSDEGKWGEDLVKASLMYNNISRIPPNASPMCPKLSTLLLQGNKSLKDVPDSLFEHLHGLNVLDLSYTGIESLPNSVSNLENLTTLRLGRCGFLKHVPSLAKLTKLRKLDLEDTGITEVPHGLEMLVNLRYLDLNVDN